MSFGAYIDAPPRAVANWTPQNLEEIDINDERALNYWTNELRISIGDLIWLVGKHGTSTARIREMVR
jgi:hypothetical protein